MLRLPSLLSLTVKTLHNLQGLIKAHNCFHNCWKDTAQPDLQHSRITGGATVPWRSLMLAFPLLGAFIITSRGFIVMDEQVKPQCSCEIANVPFSPLLE